MIITANGNSHTVDISAKFTPTYIRKIKFFNSLNGKTQVSDRGANSDKYECSFTVLDDTAKVEALVNDLYLNQGQITIDTEGGKIFGSGVDHSGVFTCNLLNKPSYPIRDLLTSSVNLKVRVVSAITYNLGIPATLPTLLYQWPVSREINVQKSNFDSIDFGDFGSVTRVDSTGVSLKAETVKVKFNMKDSEFGQLHRYLAEQRGSTIAINTSAVLELFLNSTSNNVKVTQFNYAPNGFNFWDVELTLVNNV